MADVGRPWFATCGLILLVTLGTSISWSAEPPRADQARPPVDFARDIYPLLQQHCFRCHEGREAQSGYRLDVRAELLGETNGEPLATPGKSGESRLIKRVAALDAKLRMPPAGEGESLSAAQIGTLKDWIDQGLTWDDNLLPPPSPRSEHWAFQPVARPRIPAVERREWLRSPVDAYIAAVHERQRLPPNPAAGRARLWRRVSFDLVGLPPEPEDVDEFVSDETPDALSRRVDRLLASPRYGERWGRHWLDVARWAESEGFESNHMRPYAWRYRDYVVASFNHDLPFDRFLREQLAGDELEPNADEQLVATGFLAAARLSSNEEDKGLQRNAVLVDVVNMVGESVLGLTFGCAQCHNHKFDPITQRDYYRIQALFVNGQPGNLVLRDPVLTNAYESLKKKIAAIEKDLPDRPQTWGYYSPATGRTAVEVLPMKGFYPLAYDPDELRRAAAYLLVRGDVHRRGPKVDAGWPTVLELRERGEGQDVARARQAGITRSEFVDWLVDPRHPLTARVWANRVWQYHFGRGIVATPGDFGLKGAPPTHPELLDFLAAECLERGWSTKHLHRLIVTSSVYGQSSHTQPVGQQRDPANQYWWRFEPRRLEAEAVRDSLLAVAGQLDLGAGGKSDEEKSSRRRSLYVTQKRDQLPEIQRLFDGASANEACGRRSVSTVSLQPLYLLNGTLAVELSARFADRVRSLAPADSRRQIDLAFRLTLGRPPHAEEDEAARRFLDQAAETSAAEVEGAEWPPWRQFCQLLLNLNEFVYLE